MNAKTFIASCLCLMLLLSNLAWGQSDIAEKDQAVLQFDLQLGKLRDSELAGAMNIEEQMSNIDMSGPFDAESLKKLDRVFGAVSAPADMMSMMGMAPGDDLPIQFFVRFEFSDSEAASAMMEEIADDSEGESRDGKTYYRPPEGDPQNIVAYQLDDKTVEMGTDGYVFQQSRDFSTPSLSKIWDGMPNEAIRVAADLEGAADFISQVVEMGKENAPPMARGMIGLVDHAASLQISMDLDSNHLLTMIAVGKDEDRAEELRGGLDGLMGMAKFAGQQGLSDLKEQDEDAAKTMKQILDSLTATREGTDVKVQIPKPDGFADFVKKMQSMMPNAGADDFRP